MVLLYDMKSAITNCEQELQSLKAEYEALNPGETLLLAYLIDFKCT